MKEAYVTDQLSWKNHNSLLNTRVNPSETNNSSWISRLMVIWLAGIVVFLPIKILNFPYNFELVDILTLAGMPVLLFLLATRRPCKISLAYIIPMWFVLIGSLISSFASPSPASSIIVILKEVYLFVWFILATLLLFQLSAKDMHRVLRIWSVVVISHGLLMVAQFFSPALWSFTNSLGGNSAYLENYRAAGLFICDAAGCANKAAFFQLMGFVPLLLAGFSKRTTALLGLFLFTSILSSGSMGATIASLAGLIVAVLTIAYLKNNVLIITKYFKHFVVAITLLGGALFIVGNLNPDVPKHLERIIIGRFEKSSEGRFGLWQRGIDVLLENNAVFWGVGPDSFRLEDPAQKGNQLHNDTLAFLVERGLLGLMGLALFAGIATIKAIQIIQICKKDPKNTRLGMVVFLAVLVAVMVESLTHQVFHTRELWLVLAVQEAVLYKMVKSEYEIKPPVRTLHVSSRYPPGLHVQPDVTVDG